MIFLHRLFIFIIPSRVTCPIVRTVLENIFKTKCLNANVQCNLNDEMILSFAKRLFFGQFLIYKHNAPCSVVRKYILVLNDHK